MHCGHFIVTLFLFSPWTATLVPQKSHLLHSKKPLNFGRLLPWLFAGWETGFSSILERPSKKGIIFCVFMKVVLTCNLDHYIYGPKSGKSKDKRLNFDFLSDLNS